eukprot:132288-Chlamydomonas_euryale.AAC.6
MVVPYLALFNPPLSSQSHGRVSRAGHAMANPWSKLQTGDSPDAVEQAEWDKRSDLKKMKYWTS